MDIPFQTTIPTYGNQLLRALPAEEVRRLRPRLTRIRLVKGATLYLPGERIEHVFFVEQGLISLMAVADDMQCRVEVGLIGREGLVGALALIAPGATSYVQAVVQMPGAAYRIPSAALLANLEETPTLRRMILRAFEASVAQLAQITACNSRHTVPRRLARWLLMAHDRVDGDELPLTQELLAIMLAVRRPGITIAIGDLKTAGLIRHSRGRIVICDRQRLEAAACGCYSRVKDFAAALAAQDP